MSAVFPGLGQLYRREWLKAASMIGLTIAILIFTFVTLNEILGVLGASVAELEQMAPETMARRLLPVLAAPTIQNAIRYRLVPGALGLLGVILWSLVDASRTRPSPGSGG